MERNLSVSYEYGRTVAIKISKNFHENTCGRVSS